MYIYVMQLYPIPPFLNAKLFVSHVISMNGPYYRKNPKEKNFTFCLWCITNIIHFSMKWIMLFFDSCCVFFIDVFLLLYRCGTNMFSDNNYIRYSRKNINEKVQLSGWTLDPLLQWIKLDHPRKDDSAWSSWSGIRWITYPFQSPRKDKRKIWSRAQILTNSNTDQIDLIRNVLLLWYVGIENTFYHTSNWKSKYVSINLIQIEKKYWTIKYRIFVRRWDRKKYVLIFLYHAIK